MHATDTLVQGYFSLSRTSLVTEYLYILTIFFNFSLHFILLSFSIAALVYLVRGKNYSVLFLGSLIFGTGIVYALKVYFNVSRPDGGVLEVIGRSFPSGHATIATIFFVMLMYIFDDYLKRPSRVIFNAICMFGIFSVAFSRVYLGVHWVSDVFWGIVLGAIISYLSVLIFKHVRNVKTLRL